MSKTIPWSRIRKQIGRQNMKTVGQKLPAFNMVGVTPENEFYNINNDTFNIDYNTAPNFIHNYIADIIVRL